jgi:hypothetical protein
MSLTDRMAAWVHANGERLNAVSEVRFRRSDQERPNPSAHLVLTADSRVAEMIVWDSGEVELLCGTPADHQDEHHEVDDPAALEALLERMAQTITS